MKPILSLFDKATLAIRCGGAAGFKANHGNLLLLPNNSPIHRPAILPRSRLSVATNAIL
ncbi:MAG: hypothetical protein ACRD4P_07525 [Bryobacteraceae bacterium]